MYALRSCMYGRFFQWQLSSYVQLHRASETAADTGTVLRDQQGVRKVQCFSLYSYIGAHSAPDGRSRV